MADTIWLTPKQAEVVPLVKGEKRASTSWQNRGYTPDDFNESDGIAGKCGEPSGSRDARHRGTARGARDYRDGLREDL